MARRGLKTTPFLRFLVFLLIAGPTTYIGASYINGEDGIQNFKNLIGLDSSMEKPPEKLTKTLDFDTAIKDYKKEIKALELELKQKNKKIEALEAALKEK